MLAQITNIFLLIIVFGVAIATMLIAFFYTPVNKIPKNFRKIAYWSEDYTDIPYEECSTKGQEVDVE